MTRSRRTFGSCLVLSAILLLTATAEATAQTVTVNRCAGAKTRCVMGKTHVCGVAGVRGMLKCYQTAESRSSPVDPECVLLAVNEIRDCFLAAERRLGGCLTVGDADAIQAKIHAFTLDIVQTVDPTHPRPNSNRCAEKKMGAVAEATADKLGCFDEAFKTNGVVSSACLAAPFDHLRYLLGRIETNGGCFSVGERPVLEDKIDAFVADIVVDLDQ
jgi:hypothetical protein